MGICFSLEHLRRNLITMVSGLNTTALLLIFPIGFAGMLTTGDIWERLMRLFWFLPTALLYTAYYWAPSGMPYVRFMICTFPVIVGSAFLLIERASPPSYWKAAGIAVFIVFLVYLRYGETQNGMRRVVSDQGSRTTAAAGRMLAQTLQPNAVIFSQRPFFCYIGTRQSFRHYDLRIFNALDNYRVRRQPSREKRLREMYKSLGQTGLIDKKRELVQSFLAQSRQVVYLIPQDGVDREQEHLGKAFKLTLLKKWGVQTGSKPAEWGVYIVRKIEN